MKNLTRRDFLRLSGATVLAVGMTGALSGCYEETVTGEPFGKELTAGGCKVTFIEIAGTGSAENGGALYEVMLKVENKSGKEVTLKTADFKAKLKGKTDLPIENIWATNENGGSLGNAGSNIPVAAGNTSYVIMWWSNKQVYVNFLETLEASVTIGGETVRAVGTKENVHLGMG